jgi:hypothetical protein
MIADDLEKTAAELMVAVRQLAPGQERQDALKEIGKLRSRMHQLLERSAHASTAATNN